MYSYQQVFEMWKSNVNVKTEKKKTLVGGEC
uniref:Uncharacterized protein n=1 Tax=Anguilla anguilla TaxID=7936 RepID=A0A0E9SHB0_ANGAN